MLIQNLIFLRYSFALGWRLGEEAQVWLYCDVFSLLEFNLLAQGNWNLRIESENFIGKLFFLSAIVSGRMRNLIVCLNPNASTAMQHCNIRRQKALFCRSTACFIV